MKLMSFDASVSEFTSATVIKQETDVKILMSLTSLSNVSICDTLLNLSVPLSSSENRERIFHNSFVQHNFEIPWWLGKKDTTSDVHI